MNAIHFFLFFVFSILLSYGILKNLQLSVGYWHLIEIVTLWNVVFEVLHTILKIIVLEIEPAPLVLLEQSILHVRDLYRYLASFNFQYLVWSILARTIILWTIVLIFYLCMVVLLWHIWRNIFIHSLRKKFRPLKGFSNWIQIVFHQIWKTDVRLGQDEETIIIQFVVNLLK